MGTIVSVTTSRGGAGKTSLCRVLGSNLVNKGYKVAVLDADPNQTYARWSRDLYDAKDITVRSEINHENVVQASHEMAACHDVLIIDTAGFGNQAAAMATGSADMVLIPVMPDRDSVHEVAKTARQAQALGQMARRTIPVRVVKSRWRTANLAERATLDDLRTAGLEPLDQHLSDLTEYQKMSFTGCVPVSGRIGEEVGRLIGELVALGAIPSLKTTKVAA